MKDPFKRGYPQDLPLRPSTSAHFDWQAQRRNLFDLRLPETLLNDRGILTMPIREQRALDWSWEMNALRSDLVIENQVHIQARFLPRKGGVSLDLDVNNLSSVHWTNVQAVACMRLIGSPDFADAQRIRTFWWADDAWHQLETGFPHITLDPPQPALIAVESDPAGFVFAMGWERVWNVGGNDMLHNICVHTDPWIGDLAAGNEFQTHGLLLFHEGDRGSALEAFLNFGLC